MRAQHLGGHISRQEDRRGAEGTGVVEASWAWALVAGRSLDLWNFRRVCAQGSCSGGNAEEE